MRMTRTELQQKAAKFRQKAGDHRALGDDAGAERWDEAALAADELIQHQRETLPGRGPGHMRKMRQAKKPRL